MKTRPALFAAIVVSCFGACGVLGPPDLSGVYQASIHTEDKTGCGPGSPVAGVSIFRLEPVNLLGTQAYKYELCYSTAPSSCLDLGLLSIRFTTPASDGWTDDTYTATSSGSSCTLSHSVSSAVRQGDSGLRVEFRRYRLQSSIPASGCTRQAAIDQRDSLTCVSSELQIATRVN